VGMAPLAGRWIERLLASHDPALTVPQYLAMRAIFEEGVSGREIARRTGVSGPAVSQLLAGLADQGLLERRPLAEDRRRQVLGLTASGRRAYASAAALLRSRLGELLGGLPPHQLDAIGSALRKVEAALSGSPPPRRPVPPAPPGPRRRPPRPPRS
jgi:DNA-binding MarR family transcriptional regulator